MNNTEKVLHAIQQLNSCTPRQIVAYTGMSLPSVNSAILNLTRRNAIMVAHHGSGSEANRYAPLANTMREVRHAAAILEMLRTVKKPLTTNHVAAMVGTTWQKVRPSLEHLYECGLASKTPGPKKSQLWAWKSDTPSPFNLTVSGRRAIPFLRSIRFMPEWIPSRDMSVFLKSIAQVSGLD